MNTCGSCANGRHMLGQAGQSLGFVACELSDERASFFPATRACVNGKWRERAQVAAPEAVRAKQNAMQEDLWWAATGG